MKAKKGFNLHNVCGEYIIVAEGKENIDFSNIISMNESSAYLWRNIQDLEYFTIEDLYRILNKEYKTDKEQAMKDLEELTNNWYEVGIIEK